MAQRQRAQPALGGDRARARRRSRARWRGSCRERQLDRPRRPGRARRVDDEGGRGEVGRGRRRRGGAGRRGAGDAAGRRRRGAAATAASRTARVGSLRDARRSAALDHDRRPGQPPLRLAQIHRDRSGAREQARVQRDREVQPRRQRDRDPRGASRSERPPARERAAPRTSTHRPSASTAIVSGAARRPFEPGSTCRDVARLTAVNWTSGGRVRGHPLRAVRRRHREDHDQPPGGAQRVPAGDADRGLRRAREGARGHDGRRDHPHRRGRQGVLLRRRPARPRRHRATCRAARRSGASTSPTCTSRSAACPKPVVAMVAGYAIGGGHVLHLVCDLTIAADNARFGQTGPKVGSFDGGYGAALLSRLVGPKKAKEFWMLCRQYDAQQALEMGLVNTVVPLDQLEAETVQVVPRDARPLPLRPAARQAQLPRRGGRHGAASSSSRTTPTSCSTPATRPRRAARPTRPSASPTSRSSRSGLDRDDSESRLDAAASLTSG